MKGIKARIQFIEARGFESHRACVELAGVQPVCAEMGSATHRGRRRQPVGVAWGPVARRGSGEQRQGDRRGAWGCEWWRKQRTGRERGCRAWRVRRSRHRGVDRLKAGDRRWRAWPEAKEEEKEDGGSRAPGRRRRGRKESSGRGGSRVRLTDFCPLSPPFFNSTTKLQPIVLILEYPSL